MLKQIKPFAILLLLVSLIFISSCKEDNEFIDQNKIYTEYQLFYDANVDITYASASFHFNDGEGALIRLQEGANITFNDQKLNFNSVTATYIREFSGFINHGDFEYNDLLDRVFVNRISINPIQFVDSLSDIVKGEESHLYYLADSLTVDDIIYLQIIDDFSVSQHYDSESDMSYLALNSSDTDALHIGTHTLILERSSMPKIEKAPFVGGQIIGKYRAPYRAINVVE